MFSNNIETIPYLPKEISIYKDYINEQIDPIKREVFSYSLISYIMSNTIPFPINIDYFYNNYLDPNKLEDFIEFLALNYLRYKLYTNTGNIKKVYFKSEDLLYSRYFIKAFFDYKKPIKDNNSNEIVWVYPKKDIKTFISNSFFNKKYNNYFYDKITLIRLIMIMAGFSRYEIKSLDTCHSVELKQINYPTLILANIGLYEKELLKIREDINGINVFLDLSAKESNCEIFSTDKELLKRTILEVINETENLQYTMKDFH